MDTFVKSVKCTYLSFSLSSNNGKHSMRTYRLGENHYYWVHSSIDDRFWIIPQIELYNRELITDENITKSAKSVRIILNPENDYGTKEWLKAFQYDYKNVEKDKERIMKMFE